MLKIKVAQIEKHRNETTFRPYLNAKKLFRDIGISFIFEGNDFDLTWIGQASVSPKAFRFGSSIGRGKWYLENEVKGDYVMFDGNDSASLMGTWDIFKESNAKLLLKNTLYADRNEYMKRSIHGRSYWGESMGEWEFNYKLSSEDFHSDQFKKIQLSGCNWLSTIEPKWFKYDSNKDIDVCAMFSYPAKENKEFDVYTHQFYDQHRERCIAELKKLPSTIKVAMIEEGKKVPIQDYYGIMSRSKIIIAPFGYGEIAPRDLESAQFGAVLIKPDMSHIETIPNLYNARTFVQCDWTYVDLNEKIELILSDFKAKQEYFVENMRKEYSEKYNPEKLVIHTHNWLSNLEGFGTE